MTKYQRKDCWPASGRVVVQARAGHAVVSCTGVDRRGTWIKYRYSTGARGSYSLRRVQDRQAENIGGDDVVSSGFTM